MVRQSRTKWVKIALRREVGGGFRIVSCKTDGWSEVTPGDRIPVSSCYLKIVRRGHYFYLYHSHERYGWSLSHSFKLAMHERVSVGFGAQSPHGSGCKARVTDIDISDTCLLGVTEAS